MAGERRRVIRAAISGARCLVIQPAASVLGNTAEAKPLTVCGRVDTAVFGKVAVARWRLSQTHARVLLILAVVKAQAHILHEDLRALKLVLVACIQRRVPCAASAVSKT